jgi:exodeoxyribonuclease-3
MRLISWNVNGIRAVHKKGLFLDWLESEQPDVLCLQETKAHEVQLPGALTEVAGYHSWFSTPERKGYSGVALYTKQEPRSVSFGLGVERFDNEGRTVVADFDDFVLLGIYFPNGKRSADRLRYKMEFYDAFLDYVEKLRREGRNVVVCGDVNTAHKEIDLARPKENEKISGFLPEERAWMDTFLEQGYVDTFRQFNQEPNNYSWWDTMTRARERNVGWRIDYFFSDADFASNLTDGFILPDVMGSDHCPVGIEIG